MSVSRNGPISAIQRKQTAAGYQSDGISDRQSSIYQAIDTTSTSANALYSIRQSEQSNGAQMSTAANTLLSTGQSSIDQNDQSIDAQTISPNILYSVAQSSVGLSDRQISIGPSDRETSVDTIAQPRNQLPTTVVTVGPSVRNSSNGPPTPIFEKDLNDLDARKYSLTEPFCRICYDNEIEVEGKLEKPVYACRCRGTVGLVHLSCLQKWLTISQTARCELCHFQFPTKQILRYGKLRSVQVWFTNIVDRSQLFFDISAWLIMTPIIMITLYMVRLSLKWLHDTIKKMKYTPLAAYATVMGIGTCALLVTIVYVLFTFIIVVYYTWSWYQFYSSDGNRVIVLTAMAEPAAAPLPPIRIQQ